ncbi:SOS response-associated peptidase family protein [Mitsuaria sp. GD03876]|uniref:SOS response-associated peptidase family protein n=1 Tax=Mitsuaria sp. GD03876 TaxID=2975399 RepID=UPI002447AD31|nr:SOS response-associated peptidase family protein [Mitsuaria sp. GD03876]MDH0866187.1 SOS response-associated peptidase [Mitsuaria sp. GD03876]
MCYSARIRQEWKTFCTRLGVRISLAEYVELFWERADGRKLPIPKAMEAMVAEPATDEERRAREAVLAYRASRTREVEQELFELRRRVADAERKLADKPTKAAEDSRRIALGKIDQRLRWLGDLGRDAPTQEQDARIYPGWYVPVLVMENGERVLKPMRYQCRPAGKPAFHDTRYPGAYNARRDSLDGYWKGLFGVSHGVMVASAFYENVERDGRKQVLEFSPQGAGDLLVACLWSRWEAPGEPTLLSFAAITDEPPPEVAATGHDRCVIPLKEAHLDAWLDPKGDLDAMQRILDDRERPYYEHRLAA